MWEKWQAFPCEGHLEVQTRASELPTGCSPSPPTRLSVMYAALLPLIRETGLAAVAAEQVVVALIAPQAWALGPGGSLSW